MKVLTLGSDGAARWYEGPPDPAAVKAHESDHPRTDGIKWRSTTMRVGDTEYGGAGGREVEGDDREYGEWIVHHYKSKYERYVSVVRLKKVEGRVITAVGFTQWIVLDQCRWANECRYFPVGQDGLPVGFEVKE